MDFSSFLSLDPSIAVAAILIFVINTGLKKLSFWEKISKYIPIISTCLGTIGFFILTGLFDGFTFTTFATSFISGIQAAATSVFGFEAIAKFFPFFNK